MRCKLEAGDDTRQVPTMMRLSLCVPVTGSHPNIIGDTVIGLGSDSCLRIITVTTGQDTAVEPTTSMTAETAVQ
jgi:hypothetical protein